MPKDFLPTNLFCETIRVFIRAVRQGHPELASEISKSLQQRYWNSDTEPRNYEDARSSDARRRLGVCARDLYRLVDMFRGTEVAELDEYGALERLLSEQCHVGTGDDSPETGDDDSPETGGEDAEGKVFVSLEEEECDDDDDDDDEVVVEPPDDEGEGDVPVVLKDPEEVSSSSMQTPHDPDVTYSGYKGKGYEVQLAETCDEDNPVQLITYVDVTPSSGSDATVTVDVLDELLQRDIAPSQLLADTAYGSGANGWEAECRGTELLSPVGGRAGPSPGKQAGEHAGCERLSATDFDIDPAARRKAVCPAGHRAMGEYEEPSAPQRLEIHFSGAHCGPCHLRDVCPVRWRTKPRLGMESAPFGAYVLNADMARANLDRRRAEQTGDEEGWRKTYALRAGIEATKSELKRKHGMGRLRVRGREKVRLSVYLKALACNLKRMINAELAASDRPQPSIDGPDAAPMAA